MRILKVSQDSKGKTFVEWQDKEGSICTIASDQIAQPELAKSLQALLFHAEVICRFERGYFAYDGEPIAKVRGVTFRYAPGDGRTGASITVIKQLEGINSPLVIHTPFLFAQSEESVVKGEVTQNCLTPGCVTVLHVVQTEAMSYVNGERAQMELPLNGRVKSPEQEVSLISSDEVEV